ncbi:MAG: hypothetical protein ABI668_05465 [Sphingorhabdus sp.]
MARVRLHDVADPDWRVIGDWTSDEIRNQISDLELASSIREHERGNSESLQLFEVKFLSHTIVDTHAHDEDEIMYVVEGEMILGERVLKPGSSIYIKGSTLYGFRAGPNGLRVLNFRPRLDATYISAAAFGAKRSAARAAALQPAQENK